VLAERTAAARTADAAPPSLADDDIDDPLSGGPASFDVCADLLGEVLPAPAPA
jgi:hypothetical protein